MIKNNKRVLIRVYPGNWAEIEFRLTIQFSLYTLIWRFVVIWFSLFYRLTSSLHSGFPKLVKIPGECPGNYGHFYFSIRLKDFSTESAQIENQDKSSQNHRFTQLLQYQDNIEMDFINKYFLSAQSRNILA